MPELPSSYSIATSQLETGNSKSASLKQGSKKGDLLAAQKLGINSPRSKQGLPTILKESTNFMHSDPMDESEDQEVEDEYTIDEGLSSIQNADEIKSDTLSPPDNVISGTGVPLQNTEKMANDVKLGKNDQILIEGKGVFMKEEDNSKNIIPQSEKKDAGKKLLNYDTFESSSDDQFSQGAFESAAQSMENREKIAQANQKASDIFELKRIER